MFTISESSRHFCFKIHRDNEIKQHYFLLCVEGEIKIRFFKWVINFHVFKKNKRTTKRKVCVKKMNNNKTTESPGNRTSLETTG